MGGVGILWVGGLVLLGELEGAAVVFDGLEDLIGGEEDVAEALVGEGGVALGGRVLGVAG